MKKLFLLGFLFLPFIPALSFLNPGNINYSAYYSIFVTFYVVFLVMSSPKIKMDNCLYYWVWFLFILFITWPVSFLIENYGYLTYPFLAISIYIILKFYSTKEDYYFYLKIFLIFALVQALLGISQSFFGFPIFQNVSEAIFESNRNYLAFIFPSISSIVRSGEGTFEQFNGLASYLALALPIAYGLWKVRHTKKARWLMIFIALGLITTYSRGSLIGAILGLYFVIYITSPKKKLIFWVSVLGIITLFILSSAIIAYYRATQNFSVREYTWIFTAEVALEQPVKLIYGYGPFYFRDKFLGLYGTVSNLHSGQLQIFLDLGAVGFILFISLFVRTLKIAKKFKDNLSIVAIVGGLVAFFISQLFDNAFFGETGVLWFSILAIVFSIKDYNLFQTKA